MCPIDSRPDDNCSLLESILSFLFFFFFRQINRRSCEKKYLTCKFYGSCFASIMTPFRCQTPGAMSFDLGAKSFYLAWDIFDYWPLICRIIMHTHVCKFLFICVHAYISPQVGEINFLFEIKAIRHLKHRQRAGETPFWERNGLFFSRP